MCTGNGIEETLGVIMVKNFPELKENVNSSAEEVHRVLDRTSTNYITVDCRTPRMESNQQEEEMHRRGTATDRKLCIRNSGGWRAVKSCIPHWEGKQSI